MTKATAKTAAPKRKRQIKTASKAKAASAPKAVVNTHVDAGINVARYTGDSTFVNSNRPVKVMVGRQVSKLTDRAAAGLYALRETHKQKAFGAKGFDNGILRDLLGAGLITLSGGQEQTINGTPYMLDGAEPLSVKITAAGMRYGTA